MDNPKTFVVFVRGEKAIEITYNVKEVIPGALRQLYTAMKPEIRFEGLPPRQVTDVVCGLIAKGLITR